MKNEDINYIVFQNYFGKYTYDKQTKQITFEKDIQLYITSITTKFIQYLISTILLENNIIRLGNQNVQIDKVQILNEPEFKPNSKIITLSPITVYSTFQNQFRKKTYYYNPKEPEFYKLIKQNLLKKYQAFYNKIPENTDFEMKLIGNYKEKKIQYKREYLIKAYEGEFLINGNPELIELGYKTGLSSKNSAGFRYD